MVGGRMSTSHFWVRIALEGVHLLRLMVLENLDDPCDMSDAASDAFRYASRGLPRGRLG